MKQFSARNDDASPGLVQRDREEPCWVNLMDIGAPMLAAVWHPTGPLCFKRGPHSYHHSWVYCVIHFAWLPMIRVFSPSRSYDDLCWRPAAWPEDTSQFYCSARIIHYCWQNARIYWSEKYGHASSDPFVSDHMCDKVMWGYCLISLCELLMIDISLWPGRF